MLCAVPCMPKREHLHRVREKKEWPPPTSTCILRLIFISIPRNSNAVEIVKYRTESHLRIEKWTKGKQRLRFILNVNLLYAHCGYIQYKRLIALVSITFSKFILEFNKKRNEMQMTTLCFRCIRIGCVRVYDCLLCVLHVFVWLCYKPLSKGFRPGHASFAYFFFLGSFEFGISRLVSAILSVMIIKIK